MKDEMKAWLHSLLLCVLLAGLTTQAQAGSVRISFLQDAQSLADTASILQSNGAPKASLEAFQKAVRHYYATPFKLDTTKFPAPAQGFYHFDSVDAFLSALPTNGLECADHNPGINCYDTVICLAGDRMKCSLDITDKHRCGVRYRLTNEIINITWASSVTQALHVAYPEDYNKARLLVTGQKWSDAQKCISIALSLVASLPPFTYQWNLRRAVFDTLKLHWARHHVQFGKGLQVVLLHNAAPAARYMDTVHAGLLIKQASGFTYIEKQGPKDLFFRMDFKDISDLLKFHELKIRDIRSKYPVYSFITLNDEQILEIKADSMPMTALQSDTTKKAQKE